MPIPELVMGRRVRSCRADGTSLVSTAQSHTSHTAEGPCCEALHFAYLKAKQNKTQQACFVMS